MQSPVHIVKADGEAEPFDESKLEASLERAGTSETMRRRVRERIRNELRDGMTTGDIYRRAFDILRSEEEAPVAARYSVKRAVLDLGPSGFPFEQFLAEVFRAHGWSARTGVVLSGRCAQHEVDVLLEKDGRRVGIEAKFHNEAGGKTDIKDALYVYARYEDLARAPDKASRVDEGWLATNTRFTKNAIHYAQCANLMLLGWDYPRGRGLQTLIEEAHVHPLTCLTTLSSGEKQRLLEERIVLCKSVRNEHLLRDHGVRPDKIPSILEEAARLCRADI